MTTGRI